MKIRIKFQKYGAVKYTGHLDVMRFFQKLFRRAGIDISYSKGFNPHPIMSFASPLGVGMESEGEYLDLEVNSTGSSAEAIRLCNDASTEGIRITEYRLLPDQAKNAMSSVAGADYRYVWKEHVPDAAALAAWEERIRAYLAFPVIPVMKKTKKSEREIDIRPGIYDLYIDQADNAICMRLSAGSVLNVKPELVLSDLFARNGEAFDPYDFRRIRLELFEGTPDAFRPLYAAGMVIE